jgi:hypothetical protein
VSIRARRGDDAPPQDFVVFDGRELGETGTEAEWWAVYCAWCDRRQDWEAGHPGVALPATELGESPVEGSVLFCHGGQWRHKPGREFVVCDEHGLDPTEH